MSCRLDSQKRKRGQEEKANEGKKPETEAEDPEATRSTAGTGFDFEDHVAAWLILKALTGQSLPLVEGTCTRLQTQTESSGWHLDDILVTSIDNQGAEHHLAVSCKSNIQVSSSGLPAEFVRDAWRQWSGRGAGPMHRKGDGLLLATRGHHPQFHPTWTQIKTEASGSDPVLALARIRAPAKHRKIFDSVSKPAKTAGVTANDEDALALIRCVGVAPLDFQLSHSDDEKILSRNAMGCWPAAVVRKQLSCGKL